MTLVIWKNKVDAARNLYPASNAVIANAIANDPELASMVKADKIHDFVPEFLAKEAAHKAAVASWRRSPGRAAPDQGRRLSRTSSQGNARIASKPPPSRQRSAGNFPQLGLYVAARRAFRSLIIVVLGVYCSLAVRTSRRPAQAPTAPLSSTTTLEAAPSA